MLSDGSVFLAMASSSICLETPHQQVSGTRPIDMNRLLEQSTAKIIAELL